MDEEVPQDQAEHNEVPIEEHVETAPAPPVAQPAAQPVAHQKPVQPGAPSKWQRLVAFYRECVRVLKITKKPDRQEFITVVKISGIGILIIGAIGFVIHIIGQLLS